MGECGERLLVLADPANAILPYDAIVLIMSGRTTPCCVGR
jgi:hypothetical protein